MERSVCPKIDVTLGDRPSCGLVDWRLRRRASSSNNTSCAVVSSLRKCTLAGAIRCDPRSRDVAIVERVGKLESASVMTDRATGQYRHSARADAATDRAQVSRIRIRNLRQSRRRQRALVVVRS